MTTQVITSAKSNRVHVKFNKLNHQRKQPLLEKSQEFKRFKILMLEETNSPLTMSKRPALK